MGPTPRSVLTVLDEGLAAWDKAKGVPSRIVEHNERNPITVPPSFNKDVAGLTPMVAGTGAQFVVAPGASHGTCALLIFQMEPPIVSRITRIELALRYILKGLPNLDDSFTTYLHALVTDDGDYVYYGITSRSPIVRFKEHLAQARDGSALLFHCALRDILPSCTQVHHTIISAGATQDQAYDVEEYLVNKYSLYPNHSRGLNMIPGGREGIRQLYKLGVLAERQPIEPDDRDTILSRYLTTHPRAGVPNPLIASKWEDDAYAEAVICGAENRLSAQQVRAIRGMAAIGHSVSEILKEVNARNTAQVMNVLKGKTYARIH